MIFSLFRQQAISLLLIVFLIHWFSLFQFGLRLVIWATVVPETERLIQVSMPRWEDRTTFRCYKHSCVTGS